MNPKFIISHLDEQLGPFVENELKTKWAAGDILPIDYVYDESKQDWVLVHERFGWATKNPEGALPPPLREPSLRKRAPPEPPRAQDTPPPHITAPIPVPEIAATPTALVLTQPILPAPPKADATPIKLVDGVGTTQIPALEPGRLELNLQDSTNDKLKLQDPVKIVVRSAEPHAVEWTSPYQQTVGQEIEISVQVFDSSHRLCLHYDDSFVIRVNAPSGHEVPVAVTKGQAIIKLRNTKAENWKLSFHYSGGRVLKLPQDRMIEWGAGPATKLILEGPASEHISGQPLHVSVKAVDEFGNLAKSYQGTVILEVKAS